MNALRSSSILNVLSDASLLQVFILSCCVILVAAGATLSPLPDRQLFMNALRLSPLSAFADATLLQDFILSCCTISAAAMPMLTARRVNTRNMLTISFFITGVSSF